MNALSTITRVVALGAASKWYQNLQAADQKLDEKRLAFNPV
jgi:hypothetical protein